jgi:hypothetical protein
MIERRAGAPAEVRAGEAAPAPEHAARAAARKIDRSTVRTGGVAGMPGRTARTLNFILGAWLFASAFLWDHTPIDRVSCGAVGIGVVLFAAAAMSVPPARWANTALAVWLFASAFVLPHLHAGTRWNEVLVALFIFFLSIVPTEVDTGGIAGSEQRART